MADFVESLGFPQYRELWHENEVVGEALIHLDQDDLVELGIVSVGHKLAILKAVYLVKVRQEVVIEEDAYVPICRPPHPYLYLTVLLLTSCSCIVSRRQPRHDLCYCR